MATKTDTTNLSGAMPGAPPADIADAFSQTRLLIIAAGKLAAEGDETADYALGSVLKAAEQRFEVALDWYEAREWEEKTGAEKRKAAPEPIARQAEPASSSTRPLSSELLDVVDEITHVRYAIHAAWMASAHLDRDEHNAMQGILGPALDKLTIVKDSWTTFHAVPYDPCALRAALPD